MFFDLYFVYFLQYSDTVGWVFWPVKTVCRITYIVLAQTLNQAQPTKPLVPDWVKPSFIIFDIWTLWRSGRASARASECPDVKNYKWRRLNAVWHRKLYSCTTHVATMGVKALIISIVYSRLLVAHPLICSKLYCWAVSQISLTPVNEHWWCTCVRCGCVEASC